LAELSLGRIAGPSVPFRRAALRDLTATDGGLIDRALVLRFAGPASFTGENCVEYQIHGGPAVVRALLEELARQPEHRLAQAGEFSLRAFVNGKADLTEMEALSDLIAAETETQRRLALSQASGAQKTLYEGWRSDLLRLRALSEADLDFSDEEDVPGSVIDRVRSDVAVLAAAIARHADTARSGEIIREGYKVALIGPPNAGKSSLLNALARRDVAIVTDQPGTTRDPVRVELDLNGWKVILTDTAGLRETDDKVEAIGIDRAILAAREADLILALSEDGGFTYGSGERVLAVRTKDDDDRGPGVAQFAISTVNGNGLSALLDEIARRAAGSADFGESIVVSSPRQLVLLREAAQLLAGYPHALRDGTEFGADLLRRAGDCLGRITGSVDPEDVLGAIFSQFCIGK
jgi:tRNA modification GTPase